MTRQIQCFVASAFDRPDVDAVFDKAIRPVLRDLNCRPMRVDRVEHNDDIDDKIFALIDGCDFCIADLTYARPSVYYESGYAFGLGRPVIYVARSDHFRSHDNDPNGNLEVHFDLKMRNIIPWSQPNDAFKKRLRKRVRHVVQPLLDKREKAAADEMETQQFQSRSQNEKRVLLANTSQKILLARGFNFITKSEKKSNSVGVHLYRYIGTAYQEVRVYTTPTVTAPLVRRMRLFGASWLSQELRKNASEVTTVFVFASLATARKSLLALSLPSYAPISSKVVTASAQNASGASARNEIVAIVDGFRNVSEFKAHFGSLCDQLGFTPA